MRENRVIIHHAVVPADAAAAALAGPWLASLPAAYVRRLARYDEPRARLESLLGLALLASAAAALGAGRPDWSRLGLGGDGPPCWPAGAAFSVSHAGGHVACAVAPPGSALGLDLEWRHAVAPADLRLVADARERAAMALGRISAADLWVAKEAVLKAAGAGVRQAADVRIEPPTGRLGAHRYTLQWLELQPGLAAAVASDLPAPACEATAVDGGALLAAGP